MKKTETKKLKDCCSNINNKIIKDNIEKEIVIYKTYEDALKELNAEDLSTHFGGVFLPPKNWLFEPDKKWIQFIGGNGKVTVIAILQGIYEKKVIDIVAFINEGEM